mmetsp:Transcript_12961/g.17664  ORF Transcript_12961/g.17664 Transcript_12961/m.17664 type:complete len:113 (-) Transcript_12961:48-386(-)
MGLYKWYHSTENIPSLQTLSEVAILVLGPREVLRFRSIAVQCHNLHPQLLQLVILVYGTTRLLSKLDCCSSSPRQVGLTVAASLLGLRHDSPPQQVGLLQLFASASWTNCCS